MKFRAFLALPLAEAVQQQLALLADGCRQRDKKREVRWVNPADYHVTLAFLDDITGADADRLMTRVRAEVAGMPPFEACFCQAGYHPPNARPRLVLALLEPDAALLDLHRAVQRAVRATGLPLEKRRFLPHVTLGRVRGRGTPWLEIPPQPLGGQFEVTGLHLYRSDRDATGARYRVIQSAGWSDGSR